MKAINKIGKYVSTFGVIAYFAMLVISFLCVVCLYSRSIVLFCFCRALYDEQSNGGLLLTLLSLIVSSSLAVMGILASLTPESEKDKLWKNLLRFIWAAVIILILGGILGCSTTFSEIKEYSGREESLLKQYVSYDEKEGKLTINDNMPNPGSELDTELIEYWKKNVKKVVVGESVSRINSQMFEDFKELSEVVFENSGGNNAIKNLSIEDSAFLNCIKLEQIDMSKNVSTVGESAFSGCTGLKKVLLSPDITVIEPFTFEGCTSLGEISFSNIKVVKKGAFSNSALTSISFSSELGSIEDESFANCKQLQTVDFNNVEIVLTDNVFMKCSGLESVEKSGQIKAIGEGTFQGCTKLGSIELTSVVSVGKNAFAGCSSLRQITLDSATEINDEVFANCSSLQIANLPKAIQIGERAFLKCKNLTTVSCSEKAEIKNNTFEGCNYYNNLHREGE